MRDDCISAVQEKKRIRKSQLAAAGREILRRLFLSPIKRRGKKGSI
jgi:hypothetical protein